MARSGKPAAAARAQSEKTPVTSASHSASTSAMSSVVSSALPSRASSPEPKRKRQAFRFFDLPAELRLRVYEELLLLGKPLDLDQTNARLVHPRLALFLVSHRMHEEAFRVFYSQPLRLFPHSDHGRFFYTKKPLLTRLAPRYRNVVNIVEMRLGPGWTDPPKCQDTRRPALGLEDCTNLKVLKVLVQLDPSGDVFMGFRGKGATEETYKWFCVDLLAGFFERVPSLERVEIDAWPGVKKDSPLVMALQRKVLEAKLQLVWGPLRGWEKDANEPGLIGLEEAMASMRLGAVNLGETTQPHRRVVEMQA